MPWKELDLAVKEQTVAYNAHENTPEDNSTNDGNTRRRSGQGLSKRRENDENKLESIHSLTTDDICKNTETELAKNSSTRSRNLDGSVGARRKRIVKVDNTQHSCDQTNGKDIVSVGEETNTSNHDSTNMIPAEGGLVNLGEGETTPFVGVGYMSIVVLLLLAVVSPVQAGSTHVKVVKGGISTAWSLSHYYLLSKLGLEGVELECIDRRGRDGRLLALVVVSKTAGRM